MYHLPQSSRLDQCQDARSAGQQSMPQVSRTDCRPPARRRLGHYLYWQCRPHRPAAPGKLLERRLPYGGARVERPRPAIVLRSRCVLHGMNEKRKQLRVGCAIYKQATPQWFPMQRPTPAAHAPTLLTLLTLLTIPLSAAEIDPAKLPPPAQKKIDFTLDIKPILEHSCIK